MTLIVLVGANECLKACVTVCAEESHRVCWVVGRKDNISASRRGHKVQREKKKNIQQHHCRSHEAREASESFNSNRDIKRRG